MEPLHQPTTPCIMHQPSTPCIMYDLSQLPSHLTIRISAHGKCREKMAGTKKTPTDSVCRILPRTFLSVESDIPISRITIHCMLVSLIETEMSASLCQKAIICIMDRLPTDWPLSASLYHLMDMRHRKARTREEKKNDFARCTGCATKANW